MQRFDRDSEVYKMIQENKESRVAPRQSNTFKMLQEVLEADENEAAIRFPSKLTPSPSKPTSSVSSVQKYHTCEKCGTSIVTQAVRITDDCFRHPECYTCTECGLNLKMRGHFWVEDKMFCEKHARERYQAPGSNNSYVVSPNHWDARSVALLTPPPTPQIGCEHGEEKMQMSLQCCPIGAK